MRSPPPPPPLPDYNWYFAKKKKTIWFIGVEVEQERSAPPPKKNPGSAPVTYVIGLSSESQSWTSDLQIMLVFQVK